MKVLQRFSFTILCLIFGSVSFGQLTKSSCEAAFKEFDVRSYQKFRVVTNVVGTEKAFHNSVYLDNETIEFVYKEGYMVLKDQSGLSFLIPYDKIKTIKAAPETSDSYSSILIYLVD